jgi:vacuolar-type H+-ATPase subunit H
MEADDAAVGSDALVARAMDRALDAERAAQTAIADCERQSAEILERARQQRRTILERAQARIVALHTRIAGTLERQAAVIAERSRQSAATAVEQLSDPLRCTQALERLAARLTSDDAERADDAR